MTLIISSNGTRILRILPRMKYRNIFILAIKNHYKVIFSKSIFSESNSTLDFLLLFLNHSSYSLLIPHFILYLVL